MSINQPISQSANQPTHIAIIMDGNGRWAKARRLPRTAGHKKGIDSTKAIVKHAGEHKIPYLTLYAFSSENWNRPKAEIDELMSMLRHYLKSETAEMHKNNVCLKVIGSRDRLSPDIIKMIENNEKLTAENTGMTLTIALDYGARQEILNAVKNIALDSGFRQNDKFCEEDFTKHLYTADLPDPDLLIRTGGEKRISNFLLWQAAYTELYFTDTFWPDFREKDFDLALEDFANRERRFGGVESVSA
jgi:undecaprenyl diphosphate synthase